MTVIHAGRNSTQLWKKNIALLKVTTSHSFGLEVNETKQDEKKRNGGRDRVIVREMVVGRLSS